MDSCVVPHRSTNRAVLWLTAQIGRDAVLSESYGRRHSPHPYTCFMRSIISFFFFLSRGPQAPEPPLRAQSPPPSEGGGVQSPSKAKGKEKTKQK